MQINKNRKGLALGAITALVASLFVGLAPAQANENAVVIYPKTGADTQTTMLITEEFDVQMRFGTGVAAALRTYTPDTSAGFGLIITKGAGVTLSYNVNGAGAIQTTGTDKTGTQVQLKVDSSGSGVVSISVSNKTSVSAAVSLTVQGFLDINKDGLLSAGEPVGNTMTLNFVPLSAMGAALTLQQPIANDNGATASFTVTEGTLNWSMLDANFTVDVTSTNDGGTTASDAVSHVEIARAAAVAATASAGVKTTKANNYSVSVTVNTAPFTTSTRVESLSAVVKYGSEEITSVAKLGVQAIAFDNLTISPVVGANADLTSANLGHARFNSAFNVRAYAHSASATTSLALATTITVSGVSNMEFGATSGVILNGVTYTSSATLLKAGFTLASGTTTFAMSTFGQTDTTGVDSVTLVVKAQLTSQNLEVRLVPADLNPVFTETVISGQAGTARSFEVAVEDQWGEAPVRTDLRIASSVVLGGSTSETVSANVVSGKATVGVTPTPSARTGSGVVSFTLQRFDQDTQAWVNVGAVDTATWNVFSYAAGTDKFLSRTASISASISYGVDLTWSPTAIAVKVQNSFSDVVVSAPGLMIQNADLVTQTASDTLTVNARDGQTINVKFTARLAGTYTVTFTNGGQSTTSQVVVDPAVDNTGKAITFDTTTITAGSTKVVTGTLVDMNGNPVNTSGSATILVTYAPSGNAGIPIGTMPTETDKDGKFSFTVLTGANDAGTAVVTATYYKNGASTATKDVLTFKQSINVGGTVSAPSTDQKLTVGSFKGYVAIYTLGYTGQKLSAMVAGKWLVENNLSRFDRVVRNTGAGYTIKVDLYIDGAFVRSETVVTK